MIIALAGRRVDSAEAKTPRFPLSNVEVVRTRIRIVLQQKNASALVSSAACGADLIALAEAGRMGLRRRVILPLERGRFRETSVTDRPGDWGPLYDRVIDAVEAAGDLTVLQREPSGDAYSAANTTILDEALALAQAVHQPAAALLVWDGISREGHDLTEEFGMEARRQGLEITEVRTI